MSLPSVVLSIEPIISQWEITLRAPFLIKYSLNFMLAVEIEQVVLPETDSTGFRAAAAAAAAAAKSLQ